jgi:hypothetical protein
VRVAIPYDRVLNFEMPAILMIVARDRPDLYARLRQEFGRDRAVAVVLDRRHGERRHAQLAITDEQRRAQRRRRDIDDDLRRLGWATARTA